MGFVMRLLFRILSIGCLLLAGCEDPLVDPFTTGAHYTVYGFLSPFETEHFVRVIPIRRYPENIAKPGGPQSEIDAEVTSTNLSTGQTLKWTHNLVRLNDGSYGHVFSAGFLVSTGATYRLTVRRSDGAQSVAETTVPEGMSAETLPAKVDENSVTQVIRWKNVPKVDNVTIVYCAAAVGITACADGEDGGGLFIPYGQSGRRVGNDWEITVDLSRDFEHLRDIAGLPDDLPLQLNSLQMRVLGLDANWTVYDDPDQFAQPSALNNVENGFGYWGSLGNGLLDWVPDSEALAVIGVRTLN